MSRPSRNIDQILLQSGRELFPRHGCAGLSLRLLAEHAQVNLGMFHYHFKSKEIFLRTLLQQMYDEMFSQLHFQVAQSGVALERLRQALCLLGRLMREHGQWIARVWTDAAGGEVVALEFLRQNGARHLELLMALLAEAEQDGAVAPLAPMQRFTFLMGAVVAPMLLAPSAVRMGMAPAQFSIQVYSEVLSDKGIAERVDRALAALACKRKKLHHA